MTTTIDRLNEILGHELACEHTLRRAEAVCTDPDRQRKIGRIRERCTVNCANLANLINHCNGLPNQVANPRFSIRLREETLDEILDLVQSAQLHIVGELEVILDELRSISSRDDLRAVYQSHVASMNDLRVVMET